MTVRIKAFGVQRKHCRSIRYRITIGQFSTMFYGTQKELSAYVEEVRGILENMQ